MKAATRRLIGWICFLAVWSIAAIAVHNDILLATPFQVCQSLLHHFTTVKFYASIGHTLLRVVIGFTDSLLAALLVYLLGQWNQKWMDFLNPILVLSKTIPNISYMILAILWLGSEGSVTFIVFMILFPIFLQAFLKEDAQMPKGLKDVMALRQEPFRYKMVYYLLPNLLPTILFTAKTTMAFGFKIGVMAEILSAVRIGIGRQMHVAQINLLMADVLAWTIVILFISLCMDRLFTVLLRYHAKREQNA